MLCVVLLHSHPFHSALHCAIRTALISCFIATVDYSYFPFETLTHLYSQGGTGIQMLSVYYTADSESLGHLSSDAIITESQQNPRSKRCRNEHHHCHGLIYMYHTATSTHNCT